MTKPLQELDEVLADLETLLKNPEVGSALADKGVNTSLAMLAMDGLAAYLHGDKGKAVEDCGHFAEEVQSRMQITSPAQAAGPKDKPS